MSEQQFQSEVMDELRMREEMDRQDELQACYEVGAGEAYDNAVKELLAAAKQMACVLPGMDRDIATNRLIDAIQEIEPFFEETDDPRANGWIGQDGRP